MSSEVLATYAADAAREVRGVASLVESPLHRHRGVRVSGDDVELVVEVRLAVEWGASIPDVGGTVQRRVADYLAAMTGARPAAVDVVVDSIAPPP